MNVASDASLKHLYPYAKPELPTLSFGILFGIGASMAALFIPQVLETVVNGPLADAASGHGDRQALTWWILAVLGLGIAESLCIFLRRWLVLNPATGVEYAMRMDLVRHLLHLPSSFHDKWSGGQLLSRATSDLGMMRRWIAFGSVLTIVNTLTIVIGIILLVRMSGPMGIAFLIGSIPITVTAFLSSRRFRKLSRRSQDQQGDIATLVEESVQGIRVLKALGQGPAALDRFVTGILTLRRTELDKAKTLSIMNLLLTALPELLLGGLLMWGIFRVSDGQMSVGALVAFFATAAVMSGPIEQLGGLIAMTLGARTAIDRYTEVMSEQPTVVDPPSPITLEYSDAGIPRSGGALAFHNVGFTYPDRQRTAILRDVSLEVRPGETMALVGLTGSGKSTMALMPTRIYDVDSGSITVDGHDVRDYRLGDLRSLIAVTFEDPTLFSTTVRDNVLLGAPSGHRSDHDLERALDLAQAHFVYELPDGLDTPLGEEGMRLSGGQRQRLALARAIASRAPILILDDPLSALDAQTEEKVQAGLTRELSETTVIIVAHRPSTVALADRVALLDDGKVAAVGTHSELMEQSEQYRYVISSLEEMERMGHV